LQARHSASCSTGPPPGASCHSRAVFVFVDPHRRRAVPHTDSQDTHHLNTRYGNDSPLCAAEHNGESLPHPCCVMPMSNPSRCTTCSLCYRRTPLGFPPNLLSTSPPQFIQTCGTLPKNLDDLDGPSWHKKRASGIPEALLWRGSGGWI
jgi:hypothetical protein